MRFYEQARSPWNRSKLVWFKHLTAISRFVHLKIKVSIIGSRQRVLDKNVYPTRDIPIPTGIWLKSSALIVYSPFKTFDSNQQHCSKEHHLFQAHYFNNFYRRFSLWLYAASNQFCNWNNVESVCSHMCIHLLLIFIYLHLVVYFFFEFFSLCTSTMWCSRHTTYSDAPWSWRETWNINQCSSITKGP